MSLTRNTIDGGWLEEVDITPDGEDDDDDDEDYFVAFVHSMYLMVIFVQRMKR